MSIPESLKSRKFLAGVVLYPVLVILNRKFSLGLTDADLALIVAGVGAWIAGESWIDGKSVDKTGSTGPTAPAAWQNLNGQPPAPPLPSPRPADSIPGALTETPSTPIH